MAHYYLKDDLSQPMWPIFTPFEQAFLERGGPESMALFHASMATGMTGFLVSERTMRAMPELADMGPWTPIDDLTTVQWGLLIGHSDAWETHDVPKP